MTTQLIEGKSWYVPHTAPGPLSEPGQSGTDWGAEGLNEGVYV